MTDTEREALCKRIDELCAELGRSQLNRDMWHDRAEDMRNRLSASQDENAKLHDEVERLHAEQAHWELGNCPSCPNVVSLQEALEQNAKLRELVRDAWGDGHPDRSCDGCDIRDECHDDLERMRKDGVLRYSRCLFELRIEDRMRELGIEVL